MLSAGLAGAALGWAAGVVAARARQQAAEIERTASGETVEFVDVDRPTSAVTRDN